MVFKDCGYLIEDRNEGLISLEPRGLILWHDYGRNDFLAEPEDAWGVTRFLHEIADVGVGILQGTSLGVLGLTRDKREKLARHLGISL